MPRHQTAGSTPAPPKGLQAAEPLNALRPPQRSDRVAQEPCDATLQQTIAVIGAKIKAAGGIFIAPGPGVPVPPLPPLLTVELLDSQHPYRRGTVARHALLGLSYDSHTGTATWVMIDRGSGGASDVVPGSTTGKGSGLSFDAQEALLRPNGAPITVNGVMIVPAKSYGATKNVVEAAFNQHTGSSEKAPFYNVYARTGDRRPSGGQRCGLVGFSEFYGDSRGVTISDNIGKPFVGLVAEYDIGR